MKKAHIISLIQKKKRTETAAEKGDDKMVGYVEAIHASSSEGSAVVSHTKRPAQKIRRLSIGRGREHVPHRLAYQTRLNKSVSAPATRTVCPVHASSIPFPAMLAAASLKEPLIGWIMCLHLRAFAPEQIEIPTDPVCPLLNLKHRRPTVSK
jgi:hypothetical protein